MKGLGIAWMKLKRKYLFVFIFMVVLDIIIWLETNAPIVIAKDKCLSFEMSKVIWCGLFDLLLLFFAVNAEAIFDMPYETIMNRKLVFSLAKNDFKVKYVGSALGAFWAFINPLVTIVLYWIVFQFAFQSGDVGGHPFVLWLVSGLVPWFFIQDAIMNGMGALQEYGYLVKKVVFKVSVLPAIKVLSAGFIHVFFMVIVVLIFLIMGYSPSVYMIQLLYYFICAFAYTLAITYATSAVVLFLKDIGQFIGVFMQVFMWVTPIMWNIDMAGNKGWLFKLNPAYYIVLGYRDSLLYHEGLFNHIGYMLYFWAITILLLLVCSNVFRKLRPHFADVL